MNFCSSETISQRVAMGQIVIVNSWAVLASVVRRRSRLVRSSAEELLSFSLSLFSFSP